jgi:hypothetical protein
MDDLNLTPAPDYSNPGFDNTPVPTEEPVLPQHPALAHLAVDEPAAEPIPEAVTEPVTVTEPVEVEPPVEVAPVETAPALAHAPGEIPEHGSTSSPTVRNDVEGARNDAQVTRNDVDGARSDEREDLGDVRDRPRRYLGWRIVLWILIVLLALAALALGVFLVVAQFFPDFIDTLLYSPEELEIIHSMQL